MLHLNRNVGQSIFIGDDIIITVKKTKGETSCRIAIQVPHDVRVRRAEQYERQTAVDHSKNSSRE